MVQVKKTFIEACLNLLKAHAVIDPPQEAMQELQHASQILFNDIINATIKQEQHVRNLHKLMRNVTESRVVYHLLLQLDSQGLTQWSQEDQCTKLCEWYFTMSLLSILSLHASFPEPS
jgi:hypothetical protein